MPAFTAETLFARLWLALAGRNAARIAAFAFLAALWSAALLLAERRIAGALAAPLGPLALLATATISASSAAAHRFFLPQAGPALRWSSSAALGMLGASLWLPGTNLWAITGFWAIVIAEESWSHVVGRFQSVARQPPPVEPHPLESPPLETAVSEPFSAAISQAPVEAPVATLVQPRSPEELLGEAERAMSERSEASPAVHPPLAGPHYAPARSSPPGLCDPPHVEPAAPHFELPKTPGDPAAPSEEQVVQQLTRATAADGADVLRGSLYAAFPAGGRALSVHVAFCPPFRERPRLEFHQTSGPPARIKLAQLLAFGARFDLKLPTPAQGNETIVLEISASFP